LLSSDWGITVATTELALLLGRLERLNESYLADLCRQHDLGPSELRVLAMLRHGRSGPISPTVIGSWIVQTSGGLTATLGRLEQAGHVERLPDPDDGRGRLVALTPGGRAAYDAVFDDLQRRYDRTLADIDVDVALPVVRALVRAFESSSDVRSSHGWMPDESTLTTRSPS
jgi:DNA-binding MarR family transcriptional regulator